LGRKVTKKILRIALIVIGAFLALDLLVVGLIFVPPIQQMVVDKVTEVISEKLQSRISVDKIYLSPTLKLTAEGFTIYDHHDEPMIAAAKLRSRLIGLNLSPMCVSLGETQGDQARVVLHKYLGEKDINISIWAKKLSNKEKEKKPFTLKFRSIDLTNTYFLLQDDNKRRNDGTTDIDYAYFEFTDIDWHLKNFLLNGSDISAHFDHLSYNQYTGFQLVNLSGDFKIGPGGMDLKDAVLVTPSSHLFLDLAFQYDTWQDYGEFLDSINIVADVRTSTFDMGTLACFASATRGMNDTLVFSCQVNGPVNHLKVSDLQANFKENTHLAGDVELINITDFFHSEIHAHLPNNQIDVNELSAFKLPKGNPIPVPDMLKTMALASVDIDFNGFVSDGFDARIALNSGSENLVAELVTEKRRDDGTINYMADVSTTGINLGKLLKKQDLLGRVILQAEADGSVNMKNFAKSLDLSMKADIKQIDFKRYPLRGIHLQGDMYGQNFSARLRSTDPNFKMQAETKVNFKKAMPSYLLSASIDKISPSAIFASLPPMDSVRAAGIDKFVYYVQQHPEVEFHVDSIYWDLYGKGFRQLSGNIFIDGLSYQQDSKLLDMERIRLVVLNNGESQIYRFTSDLVNAGIATNYDILDIPKALTDIAYNYCGNLLPKREEIHEKKDDETQFMDIDVSTNNVEPILQMFLPNIKVSNGSTVRVATTSEHENDHISFSVPQFTLKNTLEVNNVEIKGIQQDSGIIKLEGSVAKTVIGENGTFIINGVNINSLVGNNELELQLQWHDIENLSSQPSDITAEIHFPSSKHISIRSTESNIYVKDNLYHFNSDHLIEIEGNRIAFDNLEFGGLGHKIHLNGRIQEGDDSLVAMVENLDLEIVNQILKSSKMAMAGNLSANVQMHTIREKRVLFGGTMVNGFKFNDEEFGTLYAAAAAPTGENVLFEGGIIPTAAFPKDANINNYGYNEFKNQKDINIHLNGNFNIEKKELHATANMDTLKLGIIAPFLSSFSHILKGDASGKIDFVLNPDSIYFEGKALVKEAQLGIKALNTVYTLKNQTIDFTKDGFEFNQVLLQDKFGNTGTLQGYVHHKKFNDFDLNLAIKTSRLLILNTKQTTDNPFYGDAFVSGDVAIYGNTEKLYLAGNNLRTEKGTKFGLPISFADKASDSDIITFKERPSISEDGEQIDETANKQTASSSGMEMDFNFVLDVTPAADILLDLDLSAFGGAVKTSGEGKIHFTYNTKSDINLLGDVKLRSGSFMMTFADIITKKFELIDGGVVTFPGSLNDIAINVKAGYTTTASLADLAAYQNVSTRRTIVKTYLKFNGTLNDPAAIDFAFDLPNATSDMKTLFYSAIDTTNLQSRTEQFFSLVMLGKFSNSNAGFTGNGIGNTSINVLTNSLSNFISQQLKYVDLDFQYQNANAGQTAQYSVSASTSLFNDRTVIEGYFGYAEGKQTTSNSNNQFIGDFSIEQKLNEQGTWRVKVFNVTNQDELRSSSHTNQYAQGVAVIYKQDFNNRQDLADSFKRVKKEKKKKKETVNEQ